MSDYDQCFVCVDAYNLTTPDKIELTLEKLFERFKLNTLLAIEESLSSRFKALSPEVCTTT